jgi:hypothetical protein
VCFHILVALDGFAALGEVMLAALIASFVLIWALLTIVSPHAVRSAVQSAALRAVVSTAVWLAIATGLTLVVFARAMAPYAMKGPVPPATQGERNQDAVSLFLVFAVGFFVSWWAAKAAVTAVRSGAEAATARDDKQRPVGQPGTSLTERPRK